MKARTHADRQSSVRDDLQYACDCASAPLAHAATSACHVISLVPPRPPASLRHRRSVGRDADGAPAHGTLRRGSLCCTAAQQPRARRVPPAALRARARSALQARCSCRRRAVRARGRAGSANDRVGTRRICVAHAAPARSGAARAWTDGAAARCGTQHAPSQRRRRVLSAHNGISCVVCSRARSPRRRALRWWRRRSAC